MQTACDNISPRIAVVPQPGLAPTPIQSENATPPMVRSPLRRFLRTLSPGAWVTLDMAIIGVVAVVAHAVLRYATPGYAWIASPWLAALVFCISTATSGFVFGLYERGALLSRSAIVVRTMLTLGLGTVLAFSCLSLLFYAFASRWVALIASVTHVAIALPLRLRAHDLITTSPARMLCIGSGDSIRRLVAALTRARRKHYEIVGHLRVVQGPQRLVASMQASALRPRFVSEQELEFEESCPCLGRAEEIDEVLAAGAIDEVVVGTEFAANSAVGRAVATSLEHRCRVTDETTFFEKFMGEVPADGINADWVLRGDVQNHWSFEVVKRLMDLTVASLGLLVTLPLWPLIALAIRMSGRGPVFFRQIRVGQHGRPFTMCKFRTMCTDAERDGAQWAREHDTRVTRIGRFLRRSRLDELPQLLNILRGDMSLVGPRPERPEFVRNLEQLLPHYRLRHLTKPGLTGWAQIHYGYGASVADAYRKLCFDLYYLKHRSLELDIAILVRTLGTFVLGAR